MDLLERGRELQVLARAVTGARAGVGGCVTVAGDPGAGKTALVTAGCARAEGLRVLRRGCDPLSTPRPLGPFRDLLDLPPGDALMPGDIGEAAFAVLRSGPTVLVVEDLHWVDAASAELLRFLLRRLEALPCALFLTYRDGEIDARHPARALLGDLAAAQVPALRPAPLSVGAVAELVAGGSLEAEKVHTVTGGNPFFVAEVAKAPELPLPASVRDAVLARTVGLTPEAFEVLQLAATAPGRLEDRVLPALGVGWPALRDLHATGLLDRDELGLVFRHELARRALESTVPPGGARLLHGRLLDALEQLEPRDPAVLVHHAVAAGDATRAVRFAQVAADEAARIGSHTEAAAFLTTAIDHLPLGRPRERAELLTRLAHEQYMTSRLGIAIASVTSTFPLWLEVQDDAGRSVAHQSCALFEYYNARRVQAERHAESAVRPGVDVPAEVAGAADVMRAYLALQRSDHPTAERLATGGSSVGAATGDELLRLRATVFGTVSRLAQGQDGAREQLLDLIEETREASMDELASTGYSHLIYQDVEHRRLSAAERVLETSLAFTVERDIPICNHWQTATRARLRLLSGRWSAALEDAADVLDRDGMPLAATWPHLVRGLVGLRRHSSDAGHLDAALAIAEALDEPLRRLPALSALVERVWTTGTPAPTLFADAAALLDEVGPSPGTAWGAGDLAVWMARTGGSVALHPYPEPYRLELAGRHAEAAEWWRGAGAPFDEALALCFADDPACRTRGLEQLEVLGATATSARVLASSPGTPPRTRAATRANPSGLTNRQLDVAKLVARGFTNAEIAGRLFISPKTTDHHVSAVLTKLGMANRRAVIVRAEELGLS